MPTRDISRRLDVPHVALEDGVYDGLFVMVRGISERAFKLPAFAGVCFIWFLVDRKYLVGFVRMDFCFVASSSDHSNGDHTRISSPEPEVFDPDPFLNQNGTLCNVATMSLWHRCLGLESVSGQWHFVDKTLFIVAATASVLSVFRIKRRRHIEGCPL